MFYRCRERNDSPWIDVFCIEDNGDEVNINGTDEAHTVILAGVARDVRRQLKAGVSPAQVLEAYLDTFAEGKELSAELLDSLDSLKRFFIKVIQEGEIFDPPAEVAR
jgi:hypothetical protein